MLTGAAGQIASRELVAGREHIAPATVTHAPGVWSVVGLSVANAHAIEAPAGLIVIDTGNGNAEGVAIREHLAAVSDREVAAVIYTHSHYCFGTDGLLGRHRVPIHGHARLHDNLARMQVHEASAYHYRTLAQYGVPLPSAGPDADPIATAATGAKRGMAFKSRDLDSGRSAAQRSDRPAERWVTATMGHRPAGNAAELRAATEQREARRADRLGDGNAKRDALGYRAPDVTWAEPVVRTTIAGEAVEVHTSYSFDTDDSLILWFPQRGVCVHNHLTATFPNIVSVAGGGYRDPVPWLAGLDVIAGFGATHLLGVHGLPLSGSERVAQQVNTFRDALQFVFDQSVRGMNRGLDPDAVIAQTDLPPHLRDAPGIAQSYAEWQFGVRGIYAGLLGWYSGDAVDLHPVPPELESRKIVAAYGGPEAACAAVERELEQRCWAWAAKLARHVTRAIAPGHPVAPRACQLLADALRRMGQVAPAWTTRNIYLTAARAWEGAWEPQAHPPRIDPETAAAMEPGCFVRALGFRLDPVAAVNADIRVAISFVGIDASFCLHVRRGVAACSRDRCADADLVLCCERADWLSFCFGRCEWDTLRDRAQRVSGEPAAWQELWSWFDPWPPPVQPVRSPG